MIPAYSKCNMREELLGLENPNILPPAPKHQDVWGASAGHDFVVVSDFKSRGSSDVWTPLEIRSGRTPPVFSRNSHHFSAHDAFFSKSSSRSYSPVSGYTDSGYGSQLGGDTQSLMSFPSLPSPGISNALDEPFPPIPPSSIQGDKEINPLTCHNCQWTAKNQSQKRFSCACFPLQFRCLA